MDTQWSQEQEYFKQAFQINPNEFDNGTQPGEVLRHINFISPYEFFATGEMKASPFDFIVEEVSLNNSIHSIIPNQEESRTYFELEPKKVYAFKMIKIGISTIEAIEHIKKSIETKDIEISYAGIKDSGALTSQEIRVSSPESSIIFRQPYRDIILDYLGESKSHLNPGSLEGNRFSILLRTSDTVDIDKIEKALSQPFPNYFGTQRFGSPRYLSAKHGQWLMQGKFQEVIEDYLFGESKFEWPFVAKIRTNARSLRNNINNVIDTYEQLPYTFRYEIKLAKSLKNFSNNSPEQHLGAIFDQVDFWPKSFSSLIWNEILSTALAKRIDLPEKLPHMISTHTDIFHWYEKFHEKYQTKYFYQNLKNLKLFVPNNKKYIPTSFSTSAVKIFNIEGGVVLRFSLPKGSYATTILSQLFQLQSKPLFIEREVPFVDIYNLVSGVDIKYLSELFNSYIK